MNALHIARLGFGIAALLLTSACKGPALNHPLSGQSRYLCCNIHFEKPKINDTLYQVGTIIPYGTRVQITEVRERSVRFQPDGYPLITLEYEWGAKAGVPFDQYLDRLFVQDDPRPRIAGTAGRPKAQGKGKGAKNAPAAATSSSVLTVIAAGQVEPGMTRDQVLAALGPPPLHRTPSLDLNAWYYWHNRWSQYVVYFEGDRVARVGR